MREGDLEMEREKEEEEGGIEEKGWEGESLGGHFESERERKGRKRKRESELKGVYCVEANGIGEGTRVAFSHLRFLHFLFGIIHPRFVKL